jgi:hypothetical protein
MTSKFTVIYDAFVLYSNYLRDILIQLAIADLFRAKWTNLTCIMHERENKQKIQMKMGR